MQTLSFDQLPAAVATLLTELADVKNLLQQPISQPASQQDELLTVQQAAQLLNLRVATIYDLNHKGELPSMKRGKRLYFLRSELINYLKQGRKKTSFDYDTAADNYLSRK